MNKKFPLVSICTPTCNRRSFIPQLIKYVQQQSYPRKFIEWHILDDGTDPVEDLFEHIPNAHYQHFTDKLKIGTKRNLLNTAANGDIIIYFDDDDYHHPDRVRQSVNALTANEHLIAGLGALYNYFTDSKDVYQFVPFGPYHATAGTFAFKRELLKRTRFEDVACGEEKKFLFEFQLPLIQLDPLKTIVCISHGSNTFDRGQFRDGSNPCFQKSPLKIKRLIKDRDDRDFYDSLI